MKSLILIAVFISIKTSFAQNTTITDVNLFLVKGNNISTSLNVSWDKVEQLLTTDYDKSKKSVIFSFGWMDTLNSSSVSAIIDAYSTRDQEYNVFILDWSKYTTMNYFSAVWNIPEVALYVVTNFKHMMSIGYDFDTFHLVGFSLGAQLSGYIGRYMQNLANFTLPRITGM
jgi:predicted alpha/beta-fold hydrolase